MDESNSRFVITRQILVCVVGQSLAQQGVKSCTKETTDRNYNNCYQFTHCLTSLLVFMTPNYNSVATESYENCDSLQ